MKNKLFGWGLISLSTILIIYNSDKFADIFYILSHKSKHFEIKFYFIIIGHGTLHLLIFITGILLGGSLIYQQRNLRKKATGFILMIIVWFILALPIYKCGYYEVRHSFWESQDGHFH